MHVTSDPLDVCVCVVCTVPARQEVWWAARDALIGSSHGPGPFVRSADRWPCEIRGSGSKQSHALMSAELEGTPLQEADSPGRGARPALLGVPKHGMCAADQQASRASRSMSLRPTILAAPITRTCMGVLLI